MNPIRPRVHLPAGPLRRFRLPRTAPTADRVATPAARRRAWIIIPFASFVLLTYWLGSGRPLPDLRHWLDGPPRADTTPPDGSRLDSAPSVSPAPLLETGVSSDSVLAPAATAPDASADTEPKAAPDKPVKRKPPLVLERHRLRPVLEWDEATRVERVRHARPVDP